MNHSLNKKKYLAFLVTLLFIILSVLTFLGFSCGSFDPVSGNGNGGNSCPVADFIITFTPSSVTIPAGSSDIVSVNSRLFFDKSACVYIDSSSFLISGSNPAGITLTRLECIRDVIIGTFIKDSCTVRISVPAGTPAGTYEIEVLGTAILSDDRTSVDTEPLSIQVPSTPDFSLSLFSGGVGILQGRSQTITVDINRTGGHSEPIDLSIHSVPTGVTFSYDPNPVPGNENSSQLTLTIGETVVPGSYTLDLTGDDGTNQHFVQLQLIVAEPYTLSISPDSISIAQGQSDIVDINITKSGGFNESMVLTVEGVIIGQDSTLIDTTFNPNPVPYDIYSSQLTLTVGAAVAPGTYPLTVKGTVGTMVKSADLQLVVP